MNFDRMKKLFLALLETESPYGFESGSARVVRSFLDEQGIPWYDDGSAAVTGCDCGNIIIAGPGAARLSFCAHLDTIRIFEKKKPVCEGTVVRAFGGGVLGIDDLSGVALLLELAASLHENGALAPDIHFLFTVSEEAGFKGAWALDPRHFTGAYTFVLDSGGLPLVRVVRRGVGQISYTITLHGVMCHTSAQGTKNAALFSARLIPLLKPGAAGKASFIHVGSIDCPGSPNTVPDCSVIGGQVSSFDQAEAEAVIAAMRKTTEQFARDEGVTADFEIHHDCDPWVTPDDDPIIAYARSAAGKAGLPFELNETRSGSDAQVISRRGGRVIKISTGMLCPHSKAEHIDLEDLRRCGEYLRVLAGQP